MGLYVNAADYPVCLDDGRTLAPGEQADLDDANDTVWGLAESGRLRRLADTPSAPVPTASAPEPADEAESEDV